LTAFLTTLTASILAQTTAPATSQPAPGWAQFLQSPMTPLLLLAVVFMFVMSRTKRKQERERTSMLGGMKRGDRVQTIGGILGRVVDVEETKVLLKVDESQNTKIWFSRNAIHRVIGDDAKAEAK
jgi:preprotein translocase subunit YajC